MPLRGGWGGREEEHTTWPSTATPPSRVSLVWEEALIEGGLFAPPPLPSPHSMARQGLSPACIQEAGVVECSPPNSIPPPQPGSAWCREGVSPHWGASCLPRFRLTQPHLLPSHLPPSSLGGRMHPPGLSPAPSRSLPCVGGKKSPTRGHLASLQPSNPVWDCPSHLPSIGQEVAQGTHH